jgi:nitroreductase
MQTMECIFTRRSVRAYDDAPVSDQAVEQVLQAAMSAPSAGNAQPWLFLVIRDRALLDAVPEFHPYCKMIRKAPVAVLVCGDTAAEKYPGYWVQDCSAATQNLLLAAHDLGLGAVWTGIYPDKDRVGGCRRLFKLPANVVPLALVPMGVPAEDKPRAQRWDPAKVRRDVWE